MLSQKAQEFYSIVRQIPKGKVTTYGLLARKMNMRGARAIGNWLHTNPDAPNTPCHRVVNSQGKLAINFGFKGLEGHKMRLENEGVQVVDGKVDLNKYLWKPE